MHLGGERPQRRRPSPALISAMIRSCRSRTFPIRKDAARIIGDPLSRRGFLTGAGLALGAGSAAFFAACGGGEGARTGGNRDRDIAILDHALILELTAIAAYRRASEPLGGEALRDLRVLSSPRSRSTLTH